jgi:hypothetical protein
MGDRLASIFGGAPRAQGPSEAALKAQSDQAARLKAQEAKTAKQAKATRAVIAARSGRGQGVTLNPITGERGVTGPGKLGGG